jgi:peptide/nickel transport system permease protein
MTGSAESGPSAMRRWALLVLLLWLLLGLAAPWLAPHEPQMQDISHRLEAPGSTHWLGTDELGRDELSRLIYGARPTLGLVVLVAVLMVPIGLTLGLMAGYAGGWIDRVISGLTNVVMAFPQLLLALTFVGILGPGLWNAAVALVLTGWPAYARLARAETRLLRRTDYIAAAGMLGIAGPRLLFGHLLPACLPAVRVRLALDLAGIILTAAALGFLGLGVRPPTPEWGSMTADGARTVFDQWWLTAVPGSAIFLVSLAFNCLADDRQGIPRHDA